MFPKIAVYFGRENGKIFVDSITLWAIKTPYDKVLRKETGKDCISWRKVPFFPLITSL